MSVLERIERNVLKWFGHVERMGEERLVGRVYRANMEGNRGRGRPQRRWIDTVKDCLKKRGMDIREARRMLHDCSVWRGL